MIVYGVTVTKVTVNITPEFSDNSCNHGMPMNLITQYIDDCYINHMIPMVICQTKQDRPLKHVFMKHTSSQNIPPLLKWRIFIL